MFLEANMDSNTFMPVNELLDENLELYKKAIEGLKKGKLFGTSSASTPEFGSQFKCDHFESLDENDLT